MPVRRLLVVLELGWRGESAGSRRPESLTGLARASEVELEALPGVGAAKAAQLVTAFELGRRLLADWPAERWTIRSPADVADRLILQMGRLELEELRVILLNTRNTVLRVATVYQGNVSSSLVRVGELFRDAVRLNASGVILVHNHPSGDPTGPSEVGGKSPLSSGSPKVLLGPGRARLCSPVSLRSRRANVAARPLGGWTRRGRLLSCPHRKGASVAC